MVAVISRLILISNELSARENLCHLRLTQPVTSSRYHYHLSSFLAWFMGSLLVALLSQPSFLGRKQHS